MMKAIIISPQDIPLYAAQIAKLRVDIFKEYPYLYQGSYENELKYVQKFVDHSHSLVCLLFDNNSVAGALTGLPLVYEDLSIKSPWENNSAVSASLVYYFSELLMYKEYRQKGFGDQMLRLGEQWVKELACYRNIVFITIKREPGHPLQPYGYKPLDAFCIKHGYAKLSGTTSVISWKEVGMSHDSSHVLEFWSKNID